MKNFEVTGKLISNIKSFQELLKVPEFMEPETIIF